MKDRKKRNTIIVGLFALLLLMGVGYSVVSTSLKVTSTNTITGQWDIEIIDASYTTSGTGSVKSEPVLTYTTAAFDSQFGAPGDEVSYTLKVKNKGTIDAKLINYYIADDGLGDAVIDVSVYPESDFLAAGEEMNIYVTFTYPSTETVITDGATNTDEIIFNFQQNNIGNSTSSNLSTPTDD